METEQWKPAEVIPSGSAKGERGLQARDSKQRSAWHRPTVTRLPLEQTLSISGVGVDALSPGSKV
jgi:hypothetical protein